jgi:hypothetical protein
MQNDLPDELALIDRNVLVEAVRQDQRSQDFEISDWAVESIDHVRMNDNTGGLYRFCGLGRDKQGEREWVVVLKIAMKGEEHRQTAAYWRREECLLDNLPGPIAAPRCYGVTEYPDRIWIWMEHIVEDTPKRWELEHYAFVAEELSNFKAAYLEGKPLPDFPWLCSGFFHELIADNGFWHSFMDPDSPNNAWGAESVKAHFPSRLRGRIDRLWREKTRFLASLDRLPQVFCHNDFHRRNLMIRSAPDRTQEVMCLDWHFSGNGPVGGDLGWLVGGSLFYFEREPWEARELYNRCMDAYQAGLEKAGLESYLDLARLGCLISTAIMPGMVLPAFALGFTEVDFYRNTAQAQFGRSGDEMVSGWATVAEFCMDCADQARQTLAKLGW